MAEQKAQGAATGCIVTMIAGIIVFSCVAYQKNAKEEGVSSRLAAVDSNSDPMVTSTPLPAAIIGTELKAEAQKLSASMDSATTATEPKSPLFVRGWNWSEESSFAIAEGTVRNDSNDKIHDLEALVEFSDKGGDLISSEKALIEYQTLLPGQTSPWKVIGSYNPEMKSASLHFKTIEGEEVAYVSSKKKDKRQTHMSDMHLLTVEEKLKTLGYDCPQGFEFTPAVKKAIMSFERDYGLPVTGKPSTFVAAATEIAAEHQRLSRK